MEVGKKYIIIVKKYNPPRMTVHITGSKAVVVNHIHSIQVRLRNELSVLSVRKGHSSNDSTRGCLRNYHCVNVVPNCCEFD